MKKNPTILIEDYLKQLDLKDYRIKQFNTEFYQNLAQSFDDITTFSKELRTKLKAAVNFSSLTAQKVFQSKNSTKVLLETYDNKKIESVLIQENNRNTVCLSTQIGCPVRCSFCATGQMGFTRNLETKEIVDQALFWARKLKSENDSITNIVYMGMGEPLLNYDETLDSIGIFTNPEKLGIGQRSITLSTVGIIDPLRKLLSRKNQFRIALSLHAPNQKLRETLIPIAKTNPLTDLMNLLKNYTAKFNKRISYEYLLLAGINDQAEHADELIRLLKGQQRLAFVNLIMFNSSQNLDFERSSKAQAERFKDVINKAGFNCTIRHSAGTEIHGACGQLATNEFNLS
ncbi:23S rRNA (adenine(2503)-C(2))-methyltransferase RlmN [Candidatus Dojkabacteria bacterium]|nr:23S rRNA (adenine(2503)-C(2))-methyltransferase RlmN [Candidatus Dojkabacteria bacterium]